MTDPVPPVPPSAPNPPACSARPAVGWLVFVGALVAVFALGLLGASIIERRAEAKAPQFMAVAVKAYEADNAVWGKNYPREYSSFLEMGREPKAPDTKHGGPSKRDLLAETPANVILFAGYAFAKDYRQARGHIHAVEDVKVTGRINTKKDDGTYEMSDKTPATCWTCKSPDVPRLMHEMGGPANFYAAKAKDLKDQVQHPIGCLDCHDEQTMALRISRPALVEAIKKKEGRDLSQPGAASHQEMRTLVCAQCHVEYYFAKEPKNYLTFPWSKGLRAEDMEAYYRENDHTDWTHPISGTKMVKMQHPDYEVFQQGIHAARNVSCTDCHMPYRTEGGQKYTDHHLRSPLTNIANTCAQCHRSWSEDEIRGRVTSIQDKVAEGRHRAEAALTQAHFDVAACVEAGATDAELAEVRQTIRWAQMRWDYVAANNGMGFHAPQECQRILAIATDQAQQARLEAARILARKGFTGTVAYPDFSDKAKAQALIKQWIDRKPVPSLIGKGEFVLPPMDGYGAKPAAAAPAAAAPAPLETPK
jgi:nitrite reductase (cytochrome c-552)